MTYFRKFEPRQKVLLENGAWYQFPMSDPKAEWGFLATEDEWLIGQLRLCINRQVGGIWEVATAEEWEDLKKKQLSQPSKRIWRELFSPGHLSGMLRRVSARAAVDAETIAERIKPKNFNIDINKSMGNKGGVLEDYRPAVCARAA